MILNISKESGNFPRRQIFISMTQYSYVSNAAVGPGAGPGASHRLVLRVQCAHALIPCGIDVYHARALVSPQHMPQHFQLAEGE